MQYKLFLLSFLLCLGTIECQSRDLVNKIDFSLDMPFDSLTPFYIDPDWLDLQMDEVSFDRFGSLYDENQDVIIDGWKEFIVLDRYHAFHGGAINGRNVTLSNNKGVSIFYGNRCKEKGGAIFATETVLFTNNSFSCLFINNLPLVAGAHQPSSCIQASSVLIEDNPGLVLFKNNHGKVNTNGGAISFATELIIRNSGPVVFENNQAYWGGAICTPNKTNTQPCVLRLFADHGDIVFNNNINVDRKRNAIHFQAYYDAQFGAKKGYSIRFYDPIEAGHATNVPSIFNPHPDHLGTILFSGITVPNDTAYTALSLSSEFRNQVQIAHGFLAIEDKVNLFINQLQPGEGTLRLGNSATIATVTSATGNTAPNLNIPHLALNIPSLLKKDALPPKIWISPQTQTNNNTQYTEDSRADTRITISGDLTLLDDNNNDPYDNINLSQPLKKFPLLYLCDTTTPKIDVSNLNVDAINQTDHYGYQGTWEPFWEQYTSISDPSSPSTTNTLHRILYAHWTPTNYIPNPRNVTYLTANSLWATTYSILPYLQLIPSKSSIVQTQGKATRMILRQQNKHGIPGFNVNAKGYWASIASSAATCHHQFTVQFGQDFTHIKEKDALHRIAAKAYTLATQFLFSWNDDLIITSAKAAYSYGTHRIHNIYTDDPAYSVGDFFTQTLGASVSARMPISVPQLQSFICPFIECKGIHSIFSNFSEKGPYKKVLRSFSVEHPLVDVNSSLGFAFSPLLTPKYIDWSTSIAYQPTIYRQRALVQTTHLPSNGFWHVKSSSPGKHALFTQLNFAFSPIPCFHIEAEYNGSFASSTTNHFILAGCSLSF